MKISVVTAGEYSDYCIVAIFTDDTKLKEFLDRYNIDDGSGSKYTVRDDITLNPDVPELPTFKVYIEKDGDIKVYQESYGNVVRNYYEYGGRGFDRIGEFHGTTNGFYFQYMVDARDEAHATKIAAEKHTQLLSLNLWPDLVYPTYTPDPEDKVILTKRQQMWARDWFYNINFNEPFKELNKQIREKLKYLV